MSRLAFTVMSLSCLCGLPVSTANASSELAEALIGGQTNVSFRLRQEFVDDEAFANTASASTLRTRLTYTSGQWSMGQTGGLNLTLEADHVAHLPNRRFNDTRNGNTEYPLVVDPKGADLNQASLTYRQGNYTLVAGRQRIALDNHRFIGTVGWRQNEQTYDGLRLSGNPAETFHFDYAWIDNTRRIFGPDSGTPPARLNSNHHLFNLRWPANELLTLGSYLYALDFADAAALSSQTLGLYLNGQWSSDSLSLDYRAEFAQQSDHADNPTAYEANYYLVSAGVKMGGVRLALTRETLGADRDAGVAVQTPLATLHAFQGWADKLVSTPGFGVEDTYASVGGSLAGFNMLAVWHDYRSDTGNSRLGSELNLQASRSFGSHYTLTLKLADYRAKDFSSDATKAWLMAEARF